MTPNNQDSSEIVFDAKSGISEEEQREILAKINNIAEKNRLSLSEGEKDEGKSKKTRFKSKKSGRVFPVIVNIIAIAALAGGLFILTSVQGKTDAQIRTGTKVYSSVERALIEEIRKEMRQNATGADGEWERLNMEQSQAAAVEDQMAAFFVNLNRQIADNSLDEAAGTIKAMREFINTPAFEALRSIQAKKGLYNQAIDSLETMIDEARKNQTPLNSGTGVPDRNTEIAGMRARITQLEQDLAEKDKTIAAFSSQGSSASRRLSELQKTNNTLQAENRQLGRTNSTLQTRNSQLQADLDKQNRSAATLQQSVNTLQQSVNTLQQNIDQMTPRLQKAESDLQTEIAKTATLTQTVAARENTINERENTIKARENTISSNENTIRELQRQNEALTARLNRLQESLQELLNPNQ